MIRLHSVALPVLALPLAFIPFLPSTRAAEESAGAGNTPPTCVVADVEVTVLTYGPTVTVSLNACGSFDPDVGQTLTFDWDGCPGATFSNEFSCQTTMTIDVTNLTLPFTCKARISVSDGIDISVCRTDVNILPGPDLDIRPDRCPNPMSLTQTGVMRTVLIGAPGFDVTLVDLNSLRVQRADGVGLPFRPLRPFAVADLSTPDLAPACTCPLTTNDGLGDLVFGIDRFQAIHYLMLWNEPSGTSVPIEVAGQLFDGTRFAASDCLLMQ